MRIFFFIPFKWISFWFVFIEVHYICVISTPYIEFHCIHLDLCNTIAFLFIIVNSVPYKCESNGNEIQWNCCSRCNWMSLYIQYISMALVWVKYVQGIPFNNINRCNQQHRGQLNSVQPNSLNNWMPLNIWIKFF